jgi:hypothetical protein
LVCGAFSRRSADGAKYLKNHTTYGKQVMAPTCTAMSVPFNLFYRWRQVAARSSPEGFAKLLETRTRSTYNIHHGEGTDGKIDLVRAAAGIKRLAPDLVALQEVDKATTRFQGVDQSAELGRTTGMHVACAWLLAFGSAKTDRRACLAARTWNTPRHRSACVKRRSLARRREAGRNGHTQWRFTDGHRLRLRRHLGLGEGSGPFAQGADRRARTPGFALGLFQHGLHRGAASSVARNSFALSFPCPEISTLGNLSDMGCAGGLFLTYRGLRTVAQNACQTSL